MNLNEKFVISGAGLSGTLMAIMLAKQGFEVELYEKRGDMRKTQVAAGRSINMALSKRGILALESVGIAETVLADAIPMYGRFIHPQKGNYNQQNYSGRDGEFINSISRSGLNINLLNEAKNYPNLKIIFNSSCESVDFVKQVIAFTNERNERVNVKYDYLIGADGAASGVRKGFLEHTKRFNFSQQFLEHGYKELVILPNEDGSFKLEKNALHIWPRGQYMMIGLPNIDGTFTCTLFMPFAGENGFDNLVTPEKVDTFFSNTFPDAYQIMPTLIDDFFHNPVGNLGTIRCSPWFYENSVILIGDAAHAIVPFYGQGMNASFEDCRVLNELIADRLGEKKLLSENKNLFEYFYHLRRDSMNAVADLALENYIEMRDSVANPHFVKKRRLELKMESYYPNFFSKYSMVTFCPDIEYKNAKIRGEKLDEYLLSLCSEVENIEVIDISMVFEYVTKYIYSIEA